jgi:putative membrane protein insertion efficiency factor
MKHIFIFFLKLYKRFISPLKPQCCRFYPTCSSYAIEAISKFGTLKGSYLTVRRLFKCHPYNKGGIDYVPEKFARSLK